MKSLNDMQPKEYRRKHLAARMGTGVTLGIVLGAAMGKIALGLVLGIIIGGIGVVLKRSSSEGSEEK